MNWWRRLSLIRRTVLDSESAELILAPGVRCFTHRTSRILIEAGSLRVGYPHSRTGPFSSRGGVVISIGKNGKILCKGSVLIAPGATIHVGDDAELVLGGDNTFGHDCTILANRRIAVGKGASFSWNCTLIDDDGHSFARGDGKIIRRIIRPLIVGEDVGVQMNVVVPRGVTIGKRSVVSANTVLRQDVPERTLVYQKAVLELKTGIEPRFPDEQTN